MIKNKIITLLRWSEKYTKTDMVYLAKGGFWLTAASLISSVSSFLLAIAYANLLSPNTYGTYKYILSFVGILTIFSLPGMNAAIIRATARGFDGSVKQALRIRIKWGLLGGLAGLALAGYYYLAGNTVLTISFLIAGIFMPLMDSLGIYNAILQGKRLFKLSSLYSAILQIGIMLTIIATIFLTKNIILIIFSYFISHTLIKFVLLKLTDKKIPLNKNTDPQTISDGKHFSFIGVIGLIAGQIDKILLWLFLGATPLAVYAFALAPVDQFKKISRTIQALSFPKFVQQEPEIIKKTLPLKLVKYLLILIPIVILYVLLVPWLFKIFFPAYLESIKYSQLYALVILFYPLRLISEVLYAHAKKKELYITSTINPIFKILLLLILVPIYGINGAILALLIPPLLDAVILSYFLKKM